MSITGSALSVVIADQLSADNRLRRREGDVHPLRDRAFQSAAPSHRSPARRCRCHSRRVTCIGPSRAHLSDGPGIRTSSRVDRLRQDGLAVSWTSARRSMRTELSSRHGVQTLPLPSWTAGSETPLSKDPAVLRGHETRGRPAAIDREEPPRSRSRRFGACPFRVLGALTGLRGPSPNPPRRPPHPL